MQTLPESVHEVKSIIEAVNLKTFERFIYLKGKDNLYEFPFASTPDGLKDLFFTPLGLVFDGADPDADICLTAPLVVSPGDPLYAGDPTLSFERPVRPGEIDEIRLSIWRMRAAANEAPKKNPSDEDIAYWEGRLGHGFPQAELYPSKVKRPATAPEKAVPVTAPQDVKAPLRVVGRKLKLAWLPAELYESPSFRKLKLGEQELYRILRTYCKQAGRGSRNSYDRIGVTQAAVLLGIRKKDMLGSRNSVSRKAAEKIGICERSIIRYSLTLQKAGWISKIIRGRPAEGNPFVNKFLVVKSEKQRLTRILENKKRIKH